LNVKVLIISINKGLYGKNCSCISKDLEKIFDTFKYISKDLNSSFIDFDGYPQEVETKINENNKILVNDGKLFLTLKLITKLEIYSSPHHRNY
jgi:regulator of replication initiation timing